MFLFSKPNRIAVERFLEASKASSLSYLDAGATHFGKDHSRLRHAYTLDHNRVVLGNGTTVLAKAKEAIRQWKMFDFDWLELCWPNTPIEEGRTVAISIRHFGVYSLNAARIVYVTDEPNRFGFAYGTLKDHGECGEERFSVDLNERTGEVSYDIFAFSKPNHLLAKLGYPFVRNLQKQFAKDSKAAMLRAIQA